MTWSRVCAAALRAAVELGEPQRRPVGCPRRRWRRALRRWRMLGGPRESR